MKGKYAEELRKAIEEDFLNHGRIEVYGEINRTYFIGYNKNDKLCLIDQTILGDPINYKEIPLEEILDGVEWETFS